MCELRVYDFLGYPESCLIIREGGEILQVSFDLHIEFVGAPYIRDLKESIDALS